MVSNAGMRGNRGTRLRFVIGGVNVAVFLILGIQQHKAWISMPKQAGAPYEAFFCTMLERREIPPAEQQELWWWCCGECRTPPAVGLFSLANLGAFLAVATLTQLAGHIGVHNQVVVFYGSMPLAIVLWWYLLGAVFRLVVKWRQRRKHGEALH